MTSTKDDLKARLNQRLREVKSELLNVEDKANELPTDERLKAQQTIEKLRKDKAETESLLQRVVEAGGAIEEELENAVEQYWNSLGRELDGYEPGKSSH